MLPKPSCNNKVKTQALEIKSLDTPSPEKTQRCDSKLALLDYDELDSDDCSSGYGSSHDLSDCSESSFSTSTDGDISKVKADQYDLDTTTTGNTTQYRMTYRNTTALTDQLRTIMSIPELCDVMFEVGEEKVKVYGVKAILGTRSRVMYNLILKNQKETEHATKANKKSKRSKRSHMNKVVVPVRKYIPEDFRQIIEYIHSGYVDINERNVTGLLCGASQFDLDDLAVACWEFLNYCTRNKTLSLLLPWAKTYQKFVTGQIIMDKILSSMVRTVTV